MAPTGWLRRVTVADPTAIAKRFCCEQWRASWPQRFRSRAGSLSSCGSRPCCVVALAAYCIWACESAHAAGVPWREITIVPFTIALLRYGLLISRGTASTPEEVLLRDAVVTPVAAAWLVTFGSRSEMSSSSSYHAPGAVPRRGGQPRIARQLKAGNRAPPATAIVSRQSETLRCLVMRWCRQSPTRVSATAPRICPLEHRRRRLRVRPAMLSSQGHLPRLRSDTSTSANGER